MDEIRCPFCNEPLDADWIKRCAASLMGKTGGKVKSRTNARRAALVRWERAHSKAKGAGS
jgi:hypothetical protein